LEQTNVKIYKIIILLPGQQVVVNTLVVKKMKRHVINLIVVVVGPGIKNVVDPLILQLQMIMDFLVVLDKNLGPTLMVFVTLNNVNIVQGVTII